MITKTFIDKVCKWQQRIMKRRQFSLILRTSSLLSKHLNYKAVQHELRNNVQEIYHNSLIMWREYWLG